MSMGEKRTQENDCAEIIQLFQPGNQEEGMKIIEQKLSQEKDKGKQAETDRVLNILTRLAHSTNSPAVYLAIQMVKNPDRQ